MNCIKVASKLLVNIKREITWFLKKVELCSRNNCTMEPKALVKFPENLKLGRNIKIAYGALIHCGEKALDANEKNVVIGNNSYIGPNSVFFGEGGIEIGENCEIAPGVVITSQQHTYSRTDIPMKEQPSELSKVVLEEDVWIGCNASVLPGIRIGRGSIIGAGAVVTKNIPSYSVAVGVPAAVIKKRG